MYVIEKPRLAARAAVPCSTASSWSFAAEGPHSCSRKRRSPTAERVFAKDSGVSVRSAGTSPNAKRTVTLNDLRWADLIFVMEQKHSDRIRAKFGRSYWGKGSQGISHWALTAQKSRE